jgi:hypothetical protein
MAVLKTKSSKKTSGKSQEFTNESIAQLRALGGNLTAFTDSVASLEDYSPTKFEAGYVDTQTTEKEKATGQVTSRKTTRDFDEDVFTEGAVSSLRESLLPAMQARLASIKAQRDQPGRTQLLSSTSLLG